MSLTFCVGSPHTGQEIQLVTSKLSHGNSQKLPMRFQISPPSRKLPLSQHENHADQLGFLSVDPGPDTEKSLSTCLMNEKKKGRLGSQAGLGANPSSTTYKLEGVEAGPDGTPTVEVSPAPRPHLHLTYLELNSRSTPWGLTFECPLSHLVPCFRKLP